MPNSSRIVQQQLEVRVYKQNNIIILILTSAIQ